MRIQLKLIFSITSLLGLIGCVTSPPPHGLAQFAFDAPMGLARILDGPGVYGNWWHKSPLENEKKYSQKGFAGPIAPDVHHSHGDFVGWHGVLLACIEKADSMTLYLDHRHAPWKNVQFGLMDSHSVHTVSLSGEGKFKASVKTSLNMASSKSRSGGVTSGPACPNNWLPGDLLKVYGSVVSRRNLQVSFVRHWPRAAFELSPTTPKRNAQGGYILNRPIGDEVWIEFEYDFSKPNRSMAVDSIIVKRLQPYLASSDPRIKYSAIYNLGETGSPTDKSLILKILQTDRTQDIQKVSDFALKRLDRASGPWWNVNKPNPYWVEIQ